MTPFSLFRAAIIASICLLAAVSPGAADTTFIAMIDGAQNVPPLSVPGTGSAIIVLNTAETQLSFEIVFQDLDSPEAAAHFHNGGIRENGNVVFVLPLGSPKIGVWDIPPDLVPELFAGRIYINIHSEEFITGELRGNLMQTVPTDDSTWGRVKYLFSLERQ